MELQPDQRARHLHIGHHAIGQHCFDECGWSIRGIVFIFGRFQLFAMDDERLRLKQRQRNDGIWPNGKPFNPWRRLHPHEANHRWNRRHHNSRKYRPVDRAVYFSDQFEFKHRHHVCDVGERFGFFVAK